MLWSEDISVRRYAHPGECLLSPSPKNPPYRLCRAITHSLVDGYTDNYQQGFRTFNEAKEFLEGQGCHEFYFLACSSGSERAPKKGERCYYAVANGREKGVYHNYT